MKTCHSVCALVHDSRHTQALIRAPTSKLQALPNPKDQTLACIFEFSRADAYLQIFSWSTLFKLQRFLDRELELFLLSAGCVNTMLLFQALPLMEPARPKVHVQETSSAPVVFFKATHPSGSSRCHPLPLKRHCQHSVPSGLYSWQGWHETTVGQMPATAGEQKNTHSTKHENTGPTARTHRQPVLLYRGGSTFKTLEFHASLEQGELYFDCGHSVHGQGVSAFLVNWNTLK